MRLRGHKFRDAVGLPTVPFTRMTLKVLQTPPRSRWRMREWPLQARRLLVTTMHGVRTELRPPWAQVGLVPWP